MSPGKRIIIQRNNVLRSPVNLSLKDKDGSPKQEDKQLHFIKSNTSKNTSNASTKNVDKSKP